MKFREGELIKYRSPWKDRYQVGMVTKKTTTGYWVLWAEGYHKILPSSLSRYAERI